MWGAEAFQGNTFGEPVIPHWVLDGRPWHIVTLEELVSKLEEGLVALEVEGRELLLELEKNQGLIMLSSNASYYVHPWPAGDSEDFLTHKIFRMEQLLSWKGSCSHKDPGDKGDMARLSRATQIRERRESLRSPRYLELYIVADHTLFLTQHRNLNHTKQRLLEVASYVDQILRTLDIQVALTGLEVWTEQDRSRDHSELPIGAAATMAHEIGHSLGLSHDPDGCCGEAAAEQGGCVMAAATGHPFPRVFSACSRRQLRAFFRKGGGACLSNAPDFGLLVPLARCGNGFVEEGEECDCGAGQECPGSCCLAHNCSLRAGAQCTHGDCCARCLLKPAGAPCRRAAGDCDLPEFCTGTSPYCPPDIYLLDGTPCARGRGACRDGECPTLEQQCQRLWGPGSRPAPDACFQVLNPAGDAHGNCGQHSDGSFVPCAQRDAQCGKLQCQGGEQSALVPHTVPVDSTVRLGSREVTCRGAFVLPGAQLDLPDLGLVESGTQCGPQMVCQDRRCQNATFRELELCLIACHGHGGLLPPVFTALFLHLLLPLRTLPEPSSHLEKPVPCGQGSSSSAAQNRCVDAAEACTANARCHRLRTDAPDGCLRDQAPSCLRAYAGLVGTAVTPNYLDNASARVAPWCDCGASGNRREECEAFRGLFTRNRCLDSAIQTFDGGWLPILQDQLDPHRDPEHSVLQLDTTHQNSHLHPITNVGIVLLVHDMPLAGHRL
ncbi:ADAM metallopeptidase domain 33 [Camelus ferus]|nr:ADAM metallopeptidase domain 33 [Camelus ferus]